MQILDCVAPSVLQVKGQPSLSESYKKNMYLTSLVVFERK
jgi:hypothetical protein